MEELVVTSLLLLRSHRAQILNLSYTQLLPLVLDILKAACPMQTCVCICCRWKSAGFDNVQTCGLSEMADPVPCPLITKKLEGSVRLSWACRAYSVWQCRLWTRIKAGPTWNAALSVGRMKSGTALSKAGRLPAGASCFCIGKSCEPLHWAEMIVH